MSSGFRFFFSFGVLSTGAWHSMRTYQIFISSLNGCWTEAFFFLRCLLHSFPGSGYFLRWFFFLIFFFEDENPVTALELNRILGSECVQSGLITSSCAFEINFSHCAFGITKESISHGTFVCTEHFFNLHWIEFSPFHRINRIVTPNISSVIWKTCTKQTFAM